MHRLPTIILLAVILALVVTGPTCASEEYAAATGQDCGVCHRAAAGGGELTAAGAAYLAQAAERGSHSPTSPTGKALRFVVGYLHLLFAVLWFGTILYVHLILKPAYAVRGLPTGEKLVGIVSFFMMGGTGVILTWFRFDTWVGLTDTRFGQLLLLKGGLYLIMLASAVFVIRVLGPRLQGGSGREHREGEPFTALTLQRCDGKEGRPAYFAWQGRVYDAGASRLWPQGLHMKRHAAGSDLTDALSLAPHDAKVLERLPVVGTYLPESAAQMAAPARVFYLLAYLNLGFVFAILLVIAVWRWGW